MTDFPPPTASTETVLHSVHITWNDDVDGDHGTHVAQALNKYATTVPGLLFYRAGPDLALQDHTADFGIVALFDTSASYKAYAIDEGHHAIISELIAPVARTRTSTQIAFTC
ncbi:Dabb family protein [Rhodococcus sp. MSC1_016]|uniref:Dabb family protein n=1 Tax=Rhodococcus sp. MSC1_016 TaxID=2909266 RepID=UPI00202E049C|nr:Dabb family protein [Rhodococcus sp. MSC1_016]